MLSALLREIIARDIDVIKIAQQASVGRVKEISGDCLADPVVQKALLDRMYLGLMKRGGGNVCLLAVITADRGFCGGYNKDVIARTEKRIAELRNGGRDVELLVVGNTGKMFFERHYPKVRIRFFTELGKAVQAESIATSLSYSLLGEFIAGGVERVEIVYTRFISLMCSMPSARTLLPLTPTGVETVGDELYELRLTSENGRLKARTTGWRDVINGGGSHHTSSHGVNGEHASRNSSKRSLGRYYDTSDEEIILLLNSMLPMYVTSQLIRIVREAIASEQANRLAAMTAATDNARTIVQDLRAQYNKERQARITTEIIEVVSNTNV